MKDRTEPTKETKRPLSEAEALLADLEPGVYRELEQKRAKPKARDIW